MSESKTTAKPKPPKYERPNCPKCGKPMTLVATGSTVRNFWCEGCKETKIVKRENPNTGE